MLAYVFPGQGSQSKGMGAQLFQEFPEWVAKADTILGYSIEKLCLEDPDQQLNQTQFTQPAIYIVNALSFLKTSAKPDYVTGHSLGEYNALLAANVFDFETGLKLVKKRGELMSQASGGGMAAIVGLKKEEVIQTLNQNDLTDIVIANYNSHTQHVISGPKKSIEHAQIAFAKNKSATFIPLKVSGAFHSSFMTDAQQAFAEFLNTMQFSAPTLPVLANIDAKPYHPVIIKSNLARQITHSVQWTDIVEYLLQQGVVDIQEIGPGNVLNGLIKKIQKGV